METSGIFTTLNVPASAVPSGINNAGQVVGSYTPDGFTYNSFLYANGVFTTISAPGAYSTTVTGINNAGQIVGYYKTAIDVGSHFEKIVDYHGFVDTNGVFTIIDVPAGVPNGTGLGGYQEGLFARGINDAGTVVGNYDASSAFVYINGVFTSVDVSAADLASIGGVGDLRSINDAGQVLGFYDDGLRRYSVIATPATAVPEPASAALLGVGLAGLGLASRRRARA